MPQRKTWIEVSASALEHNLLALGYAVSSAPEAGGPTATALLGVVKANAYGHGAPLCATVLARAGAAWLGVTDAEEGRAVRGALHASGIASSEQPDILIMCGSTPADWATVVTERLVPVVWTEDHLTALAAHLEPGKQARVHLEIDTGMTRQGVLPGAPLERVLQQLRELPRIVLDGVMTHFASAEVAHAAQTSSQQRSFTHALEQIAAAGLTPRWIHAGNTATVDEATLLPWLHQQAHETGARLLVRAGLALFGYALPVEGGPATLEPRLRPVGTWKTRVLDIRDVPAGSSVGYNATYHAKQPMRLALLPVGYADGLRRELSGTDDHAGGWVMVRGYRAPIVGRISMNLTMVNVTAVPDVLVGDEVVLLGEGISADQHAHLAGTIAYEILCAMHGDRHLVP